MSVSLMWAADRIRSRRAVAYGATMIVMKDYVYVICETINGIPSFRHAFIKAKSVNDAYDVAHRDVRQPNGNGINDYVIRLTGMVQP